MAVDPPSEVGASIDLRSDALGQPPDEYETTRRQVGQWRLVWRRFQRHRLAVIGGWVLLLLVLLALIGPFFAPSPNVVIAAGDINQAPRLWPLNLRFLLGTDARAVGITTYVLGDGRATLTIGLLGALIASLVGMMVGGTAGYFGRLADTLLMRLTDVFLTIPFIPLILLLTLYLQGPSVVSYAILFGLIGWAGVARLVRGYVVSLRQREFAEAARALGASDVGIIVRHLLPNALDVIVVSFTLNAAVFMVTEANVQLAGTWGSDLNAQALTAGYWWVTFFPGVCLLLTVLAVNFLGDGLRDALVGTSGATFAGLESSSASDEEGGLERAAAWLGRRRRSGVRVTRDAALAAVSSLGLPRRRQQLLGLLPARLQRMVAPERTTLLGRWYQRPPLALQVVPIVLVMLALAASTLYEHSPLRYAPHFPAPVAYGIAEGADEYGAVLRPDGGWDLLRIGLRGAVEYTRANEAGRILQRQVLGQGGSQSTPTLAGTGSRELGVWVSPDESSLEAAYLGGGTGRPFALLPPGGAVQHPFAVRTPSGFVILFGWERSLVTSGATYRVYEAILPYGARRLTHLRLIDRSSGAEAYGFYPRGAVDSSGALDALWLERVRPGQWEWRFGRFGPNGGALGKAITVDTLEYYTVNNLGRRNPEAIPAQWGATMQRAANGSVWAAWEANQGLAADTVSVAHWSRSGVLVQPPTVLLPSGLDSTARAIGLAPLATGGQLYTASGNTDGGIGLVAEMQAFDAAGSPVGAAQRVAYDGNGTVNNPQAATRGGRPAVIWERSKLANTVIEGTTYQPRRIPPDLFTRFGLNIGSVPTNMVLVTIVLFAGGVLIAALNPILLGMLLLVWLAIGRVVPRRLRWTVYLVALAGLLIHCFAGGVQPPGYVILIQGLGSSDGWYAVLGAVLAAWWSGAMIFRRYEGIFRAAAMAMVSLTVIGGVYAVILVQNELTRI